MVDIGLLAPGVAALGAAAVIVFFTHRSRAKDRREAAAEAELASRPAAE